MRKTLVILTPGFPENEDDTTCIPPQQIFVKVLKESYPDLNIIVVTFQYPFFAGEYQWNGVKVIAIGGEGKSRSRRGLTWLRAWRQLKQLNKDYRLIGLLSFWLGECAFVGDKFAKRYNLKHYCWMLGQDAKAGNKYVNWIKPTGDNLIALSDFIRAEFNRNYGIVAGQLVSGAVDSSLFKNAVTIRDVDVMGAGSLIPLKQYTVFVDVVFALKKYIPNIRAVLCGKGPEMEMLQAKINKLDLAHNITLMGEVPHAEVLTLMQRTKVFLHTSNYEGFGLVCLEALYAGAKVISFVRPMDEDITNWHIAPDAVTMQRLAAGILKNPDRKHYAVLPYAIKDNAHKMMALFNQQEAAIS
jgi:glycosyltransferase involved in cell wall biosynthesis